MFWFNKLAQKQNHVQNVATSLNTSMICEGHQSEVDDDNYHDFISQRDLLNNSMELQSQNISVVTNHYNTEFNWHDQIESLYGKMVEYQHDINESIVQKMKNKKQSNQKIEQKDFNHYVRNIQAVNVNQQQKKLEFLEKQKQLKKSNYMANIENIQKQLEMCYNNVPGQYFRQNYSLRDFEGLTINIKELNMKLEQVIMNYKEQLTDYLDEVEINICLQINLKFKKFIKIFEDAVETQKLVQMTVDDLQLIKYILISNGRKQNKEIRQKILQRGLNILDKKQKMTNIEKLRNIIKLMRILQSILKTVEELMVTDSYKQALDLIIEYEKLHASKLSEVQSFKHYSQKIFEAKAIIEKKLIDQYFQNQLTYVSQQYKYQLRRLNTQIHLNLEGINQLDDEFPFQLVSVEIDSKIENQLSEYLQLILEIKEYFPRNYRFKLMESLKSEFKQYLKTLVQKFTIENQNEQNYEGLVNNYNSQIFFASQMFCFQMNYRMFSKQIQINNIMIQNVFKNLSEMQTRNDKEIYQEFMEDSLSTVQSIIKFIYEKQIYLANFKRFDQNDLNDFVFQNFLYSKYQQTIETELATNIQINPYVYEQVNPKNKENIQILYNNFVDQLNKVQKKEVQSYAENIQCLNDNFIKTLNKKYYDDLRMTLENENWKSANIPYDFKQTLQMVLVEEYAEIINQKENEEFEKKYQRMVDEFGVDDKVDNETGKTEMKDFDEVEIQKNIIKYGQKQFKISQSCVKLVNILCQYCSTLNKLNKSRSKVLSEIVSIIKLYNSISSQLVLGAGSVALKKVQSITTKNIGLLSSDVSFVIECLARISQKVNRQKLGEQEHKQIVQSIEIAQKDLNNHYQELIQKLVTIFVGRIRQLVDQLSKTEWNNPNFRVTVPSQSTALLLKDIRTMFNQVEEYFSVEIIRFVFGQIYNEINQCFVINYFQSICLDSMLTAQRIKEEIEYFLQNIEQLKSTNYLKEEFTKIQQNCELIMNNVVELLGAEQK